MAITDCKPLPQFSQKDIERFWKYVDKRGPDDCWLWTGLVGTRGYGKFGVQGKTLLVHRVGLFLYSGVDPYPLQGCHSCDVRYAIDDRTYKLCCNGAHLFAGTQAANQLDMKAKGRGTVGDRSMLHRHPELALRGEDNGNSKLTAEQVLEIRELHRAGITQTRLGPMFGVDQTAISCIVLRKVWQHL